jgi:hypothetical protein
MESLWRLRSLTPWGIEGCTPTFNREASHDIELFAIHLCHCFTNQEPNIEARS